MAGQTETTPPSLLWLEGIGDGLVTNNSTRAAADELGIPLVRPVQRPTPVLEEVDAPLSENIAPDVTAGHFQYDPVNTPSCRDLFFEFEGHYCPQIALEAEEQIEPPSLSEEPEPLLEARDEPPPEARAEPAPEAEPAARPAPARPQARPRAKGRRGGRRGGRRARRPSIPMVPVLGALVVIGVLAGAAWWFLLRATGPTLTAVTPPTVEAGQRLLVSGQSPRQRN